MTEAGQPLQLDALKGNVVVYDFIFTNCAGTCPMMTAAMRRVTAKVDKNAPVRFVSISVDPKRDTPPVLQAYASKVRNDPRWTFLTGDWDTIRHLSVEGFKLATDEQLLHSAKFAVADKNGVVREYVSSLEDDAVEGGGEGGVHHDPVGDKRGKEGRVEGEGLPGGLNGHPARLERRRVVAALQQIVQHLVLDEQAVVRPGLGQVDGVWRLPPPGAFALVGGARVTRARHLVPFDGSEVARDAGAALDLSPPGAVGGGRGEHHGARRGEGVQAAEEQQQAKPAEAQRHECAGKVLPSVPS